jgi:hypothetical protein
MRPIDTIKIGIDSDLTKYHGSSLCYIEREDHVQSIRGIGLCAIVRPFDKLDGKKEDVMRIEDYFPVVIVNRTKGFWEKNFHEKYLVMVMGSVTDRRAASLGYAVPITFLSDMSAFLDETLRDESGKQVKSKTRELSLSGKSDK